MIPEVLINKIILYNSSILSDIFRSRLKINSLMILFKWPSGKYIRLWHYMQDTYNLRWARKIDQKILRSGVT